MARPRRTQLTTDDAMDEASVMEGVTGDDPAPGATATRRRRAPAKATGNRARIPARTAGGRIKGKAEQVKQVRDELEFFLSLGAATWSLRDEECASSATPERIATIADALSSMVARNDRLLAYAANSGLFGDMVRLLSAAAPIAMAVIKAHGPGGKGHGDDEGVQLDDRAFPAYAAG